MPLKFFITHSWKDIEFARRLCDDLHANGLEGFLDAYSIQPGENIAARIAHGLDECDVYVPILSPAALESPWCEEEINAAITLSKERVRKGRPRIVPVVIQACDLPVLLKPVRYIDFAGRYNDALQELVKAFGVQFVPQPGDVITTVQIFAPTATGAITLPRTKIGKDGKELILVPAGEFLIGSDKHDDEKPPHKVYLDTSFTT